MVWSMDCQIIRAPQLLSCKVYGHSDKSGVILVYEVSQSLSSCYPCVEIPIQCQQQKQSNIALQKVGIGLLVSWFILYYSAILRK